MIREIVKKFKYSYSFIQHEIKARQKPRSVQRFFSLLYHCVGQLKLLLGEVYYVYVHEI